MTNEIKRLEAFIKKNANRHRKPKTQAARLRRINVTIAAYSKLELATGNTKQTPIAPFDASGDIIDGLPFSRTNS